MIKRLTLISSITLFFITCGFFGLYLYKHYSILPTYQKKFSTMVNNRIDEVNVFLHTQENNAIQLAQESIILQAFRSSPPQNLSYIINSYKENMQFKNILLIDKNGKIIFSTTQKNIVGKSIYEQTHSPCIKSYERATMTFTNDFSAFDFDPLIEEPAVFITIPILKDKKYIGALTYELDEEKIYRLTNQYIGLGKTGEIVLARKERDNLVFIYPTRNDPDLAFKKRTLSTYPPISSQSGALGKDGSGAAIDYREKKVIAAWKFIPKLDWGIVVKIDLDEALESTLIFYTLFIILLSLFTLSILMNTYLFWEQIQRTIAYFYNMPLFHKIPAPFRNVLSLLFIIFLTLTIKNIIICELQKSSAIENAKKETITNNEKNTENITKLLKKIIFIGESIARDLQTNYLKKEDLPTRIKRDLTENNILTDITIAYIPYGYNDKTEIHIQTSSTKITNSAHIFEAKWYKQALEKNSTWIINPIKDTDNTPATSTYACTFKDNNNNPLGVIAVTFSLHNIINIIEASNVGRTGYSFITTDTGAFIFHPIATLVQKQTTLLEFAQANGNEELASIAQKTLDGHPQTASYEAYQTKERYWIATQPIPTNKWILGTIFAEDEVSLSPQKIRSYYFWIILWLVITLILFTSLLCKYLRFSSTIHAAIVTLILLLGIIAAWYAITITYTINRDSITLISDQSSLDKFLNDLNEESARKHEQQPINIPCGLLLYSLNIPDPDHIEISGYIWTKYNTQEHANIAHGIDILQSTRMIIGKPVSATTNLWETETWTIQGVLTQEQQNAHYPFDQQQLRIILEHRDIEKNLILTPDLTGYKKISPEATPGLDKDFSISGFTVAQTFFEYKQFDPKVNFGFKEYGKVSDHFHLIYNVILKRNLLNPFVLYILPLLVILFSLFCTLLVAQKNTSPFTMLGAYTALCFSLIVLQRSLREQHPSGATLYIEYAFFYTYITIILLILYSILNYFYKHTKYQDTIFHLMKLLFWPFQLITWLITTLVIFY